MPARPRALVTGAAQGIGASIAAALAAEGYDLALSARDAATLGETLAVVSKAGARAVPLALDLRDTTAIEHAVPGAIEALGGLDLLVNNAGATLRKPALNVTPEEWDAISEVNLRGTFFLSQQLGRHWVATARPGCIVNIASTHGLVAFAQRSTYGVSKAGVIHLTRMLAHEWAEHDIRVNVIAPGLVYTPSRAAYFDDRPAERDAMLARIPSGRFASPEDVANAVIYLAGSGGGYVTGHTLTLDGGVTAY